MHELRAVLSHRLMTLVPFLFLACGHKRTLATPTIDAGDDHASGDAGDGSTDSSPDAGQDAWPDGDASDGDAGASPDLAGLGGDVAVFWLGTTPAMATAGQPIFLDFEVKSFATEDDIPFTLVGHLVDQTWPISIVDASHTNVVAPPQIFLNRNQSMAFAVRLDLPSGTDGQSFFASAQAIASPNVASSTGLLSFTVGGATPQPDPAYTINTTGPPALVNGARLDSGDTLVMPQVNSRAIIHLEIDVPAGETLNLTMALNFFGGATAAGWTNYLIPPGTMLVPPSQAQPLDLDIRATANSTPGFVSIVLTNNGVPSIVDTRTFALRTN